MTKGRSGAGEGAEAPPNIKGELVILRPFKAADIDERYIGWLNDGDVVRFSNQRFRVHDQESCTRYFDSFAGTDNLFLIIEALTDYRAIGTLTVYFSKPHNTADVGILIGEKAVWGCGYGKDAWTTVVEWLLKTKRVRKVTAGTLKSNLSMIALMEYSGMKLEAVRKDQEIVDGTPSDILYYAKFGD